TLRRRAERLGGRSRTGKYPGMMPGCSRCGWPTLGAVYAAGRRGKTSSGVEGWRSVICCFFFFQAEDGIRDKLVTGVQTCALPIFDLVRNPLIGGSKGVTMAQAGPDDLDQLAGANTIEGDVENDTNSQGGIDKAE